MTLISIIKWNSNNIGHKQESDMKKFDSNLIHSIIIIGVRYYKRESYIIKLI